MTPPNALPTEIHLYVAGEQRHRFGGWPALPRVGEQMWLPTDDGGMFLVDVENVVWWPSTVNVLIQVVCKKARAVPAPVLP